MKKIRVLVIGMTNILGGVETFIRNVYSKFDYEKFEVDYLHHSKEGILFEDKFKENGSNIYYCEKFSRHPIKSYRKIKSIIKNGNYDVIHCNACSANMIVYFLPAIFMKKKPLIVMHSHSASSEKKIRHYAFRFLLNKKVDIKYACSEKAGVWMYGKNKEYEIILNGIDVEKFKFNNDTRKKLRDYYSINEKEILLGSVGRLEKVKNHQFIINIMKKLPNNYKYMIIGSGTLKNKILETIENENLKDRVIVLDNLDKIYDYYQMFDIYVMPSIFEGLPLVCVEAQTAGLPLILSNDISHDTKLTENVCFIDISDEKAWINQIISTKIDTMRDKICMDRINEYDNQKVAIKIENDFERKKRLH